MSGTRFPDRVETDSSAVIEPFATLDALPPGSEALFTANPGLFDSRGWWSNVLAFGLPRGAQPVFLLFRLGGTPAALLPLQRSAAGRLTALTTPYTCVYRPLLDPGLDSAGWHAVFGAFARYCRGFGYVRFDALPADLPCLQVWAASARAAGLAVLRFDAFGNWYEPVAGVAWQAYLASRQGALRETIRRRLHRAERDGGFAWHILCSPREVEAGIADYERVYARSWKRAEPFPGFVAGLLRAGAESGWLRLGLLKRGEQPIAAQLWSVEHGRAIVHKLAHDEAFKSFSPGTVLTAYMLRHLLDAEHVTEIDFGRGDDEYKQGWAGWRRQRIGMVLVNPRRPAGMATLLRHGLGRMRAVLRPGSPQRMQPEATRWA